MLNFVLMHLGNTKLSIKTCESPDLYDTNKLTVFLGCKYAANITYSWIEHSHQCVKYVNSPVDCEIILMVLPPSISD